MHPVGEKPVSKRFDFARLALYLLASELPLSDRDTLLAIALKVAE